MLGETNFHISTGTSFCIKAPYGTLENRSLQSPTFNKCGDWNIILSTFHHVINRLSGLGAHFKIVPLHSAGASKRLKVVTLRMRRYTSRETIPDLRARLLRTKENSLTCAKPAETIHLMYLLFLGRIRERTSTAKTNFNTTTASVRHISTVSS